MSGSDLTLLCLSFPLCTMGTIIVPSLLEADVVVKCVKHWALCLHIMFIVVLFYFYHCFRYFISFDTEWQFWYS